MPIAVFILQLVAKEFPQLLESRLVLSYHSPTLPSDLSAKWRHIPSRTATCSIASSTALFSSLALLATNLLLVIGSQPTIVQKIIVQGLNPLLVAIVAFLGAVIIRMPYLGLPVAFVIILTVVVGFFMWVKRHDYFRKSLWALQDPVTVSAVAPSIDDGQSFDNPASPVDDPWQPAARPGTSAILAAYSDDIHRLQTHDFEWGSVCKGISDDMSCEGDRMPTELVPEGHPPPAIQVHLLTLHISDQDEGLQISDDPSDDTSGELPPVRFHGSRSHPHGIPAPRNDQHLDMDSYDSISWSESHSERSFKNIENEGRSEQGGDRFDRGEDGGGTYEGVHDSDSSRTLESGLSTVRSDAPFEYSISSDSSTSAEG